MSWVVSREQGFLENKCCFGDSTEHRVFESILHKHVKPYADVIEAIAVEALVGGEASL